MTEQQNESRSFVQAELSNFSRRVSEGYHKPVRGFFKEMLTGLCGTGKPSLHNIAKFIQDNTNTKKTSERLYRNIRRENLAEDIENKLTDLLRSQVTDDTLFIVDDSDIAKPYAKSMEGCAKVHNGSESKSTNGFLLMNIFAMLAKKDGYNLLPASSILFSPSIELDSAKQVLQDTIVDQQIAFRNKGTYVFDRGYDDRKLIGFLVDNGVSFVIRGMGTRAIKDGTEEKNFKQEVEKIKFKYKFPGLRKGEELHCATRRIGVRTDDHPSKKANSVEISLEVVRKFRDGSRKGKDFYLLCDFDDPHMSEKEIITRAMDIYRRRWAIEEVHRQIKQSMNWEGMRLKSYQGMKNLNGFMALAIYFIYKLKDNVQVLAIGFPKLIAYKKTDRHKVVEFCYYRICEVVSTCLTLIVQYRRKPNIQERRDHGRRKSGWIKNGGMRVRKGLTGLSLPQSLTKRKIIGIVMRLHKEILALLRQEVVPAMGCTEPAAVALAAAYAASIFPADFDEITVKLSPSILKNGMGVGIPNTGLIGLEIAVALGLLVAKPEKELQVLADLEPKQIAKGKELAEKVKIELYPSEDKVYIEVQLHNDKDYSRAILRWRHTWLYKLELNGKVLKYQDMGAESAPKLIQADRFKLLDYFDFCHEVDYDTLLTLDLGESINRRIADFGLSENLGMSVGRMIMQQIENGLLGNDIHNFAMALTAAATDARMSGCNLPVISNTGSGNQGLSITLPIIAAAEKLGSEHEKLVRALALGHLVSVHIKNKVGLLSCLCGCLSAAAGAASGIVYLLDGEYQKVEYAIKNMIGNTAGMVCDGAKEGCSLKVSTNTSAAVQSALLANMGRCISANDGIVTEDVDETIDNLAEFVNSGMQNADSTILNIMINKKNHKEARNG